MTNHRWCIESSETIDWAILTNACVCFLCLCVWMCVRVCVFFFSSTLCMLLLTLDWIGWTGLASSSGLVWLCSPVVCLALCTSAPFGVRQASVNCPLPMVKLLQTPRCYGDWRPLWVVPWTKLLQPWPVWEPKTHSTPAKPTSMYLAHTDAGVCQFILCPVSQLENEFIPWYIQVESFSQHACMCVRVLFLRSDCVIEAYVCSPVTVAVIVAVWLFSAVV